MWFLACCPPIIRLDDCLLKGTYSGKLLHAMGCDGIEAETKDSWSWFLVNLISERLRKGDGLLSLIGKRCHDRLLHSEELYLQVFHLWRFQMHPVLNLPRLGFPSRGCG